MPLFLWLLGVAVMLTYFLFVGDRTFSLTYIPLFSSLALILFFRAVSHLWLVDHYRREDCHYVRSQIVLAKSVRPRLDFGGEVERQHYREKKLGLLREVRRLERIGLGSWQDWQILPLSNLLVDFMKVQDLIGHAQLKLDELEDYAGDIAYSLDRAQYQNQQRTVEKAIDKIQNAIIRMESQPDKDSTARERARERYIDRKADSLRAAIRSIHEYVIEYEANWAKGTILLSGLKFGCVVSIPIFLLAGLLPVTTSSLGSFDWFNWAFMGTSGALTAVLWSFLQTDVIEVGHATSRSEVSRALVAAILGFVSATMFFAFAGSGLAKGLLNEGLIPTVVGDHVDRTNVYLSILWAFFAGFLFEKAIEHVRHSVTS